ncbi:TPA: trypsin-like peptidase domain-containing protein [Elizabethkingia anophelis]|uniref:S1 family peptidase n=1 Tax=Elizabethkingia anophelis TaxID=1117645 RepID=UPI0004087E6F|nr:serine protease [Elizabethkingia anophelis]MCT3746683.1 trypsin-like peptidase domain-containing protein [Elizabethkingia anophelis]MDC8025757.1 serine protease [Elizabethkingia anophelis]MDV3493017.1 serine protease [Elizabethkingia anophelis]MDV4129862.1 serine protease [Elizabethkingia anophelis]MDV4135703.1 serine protease [Elizabethkingia anophelis]
MLLIESFNKLTVRLSVTLNDGKTTTGTGFLFMYEKKDPSSQLSTRYFFIITNKHVVENGINLHFRVKNRENSTQENIDMLNIQSFIVQHPERNVDLCAINISQIFQILTDNNKNLDWQFLEENNVLNTNLVEEIKSVENIFMIGYPDGLMDEVNNRPLIRTGITSTSSIIRYNGEKLFIVDLPCFPGSSGSPIFISEGPRITKEGSLIAGVPFFALIGVCSQMFTSRDSRTSQQSMDLGVAINYEAINELIAEIKRKIFS